MDTVSGTTISQTTISGGVTSEQSNQTVTNVTEEYPGVPQPQEDQTTWLIPPFVFLIFVTCSCNVLVMILIAVSKPLRSTTNVYIFSLAAADFLVGSIVMGGMLIFSLHGHWPLGGVLCTAWIVSDFSCCTVSMLHLCIIAHDRYRAIIDPLSTHTKHVKKSDLMIKICLSWIVGIAVWLPAIIYFRMYTNGNIEYDCFFVPDRVYILCQAIFVYYGPIIAMVCFYIKLVYELVRWNPQNILGHSDSKKSSIRSALTSASFFRHSSYEMSRHNHQTIANNAVTPEVISVRIISEDSKELQYKNGQSLKSKQPDSSSGDPNKKLLRKQHTTHMRAVRTLGAIIITFLLCWLPFCLAWPIDAYCECIPVHIYEATYWAAYLNSAINPMLYFLCNKDFRAAFVKLCACSHKGSNDSVSYHSSHHIPKSSPENKDAEQAV